MCGRYTLTYEEQRELEEFLGVEEESFFPGQPSPTAFANFNVAPSHNMPVACTDGDGNRIVTPMYWGFMGWKPKPGSRPFLPINTRDDSVAVKPMWRKAFFENRCIIPASGFYEWSGKKGNRIPHYVYPVKEQFMGFAGIYSELAPEGSGTEKSYSIITTSPNQVMKEIHDRMPVILHPSEFEMWLDPGNRNANDLLQFLRPYPDDGIGAYTVSREVGNVSNNHEGLIQKNP